MFFYGNEGEAYFSSYYLLFLQMHIADRDVKKPSTFRKSILLSSSSPSVLFLTDSHFTQSNKHTVHCREKKKKPFCLYGRFLSCPNIELVLYLIFVTFVLSISWWLYHNGMMAMSFLNLQHSFININSLLYIFGKVDAEKNAELQKARICWVCALWLVGLKTWCASFC